jgi:hypothetical protein
MRTVIRRRGPSAGPAGGRAERRFAGRAALAAAFAAALALTSAPAESAASTTVQASTAQATAVPASAQSQTVTLPTGEQVIVGNVSGKTTYAVGGLGNGPSSYGSYQAGSSDHYIIPSEAEPYLGSVLSPSLFDVTQLLHAGLTGGAHIPVSLAFAAGEAPTAPPGVTLTSTAGSTAQGYLTASSGAAFAAGLRAAIGADVAAGRPAGTGALFGGLASMSLATSAVAPPGTVRPDYVLHTLQVDSTAIDGTPFNVFPLLLNDDSASTENADLPIQDGIGRIEVPAGDYSLGADVYDFDANGLPTAARTMVLNDFTVPDTSGVTTTVQFDEGTAISLISGTTPRPSTPQFTQTTWTRLDPTGLGDVVENLASGGVPMYVDPQPAATTAGSMHFQVQLYAAGPATGPQYRYDSAFDNDTIPADQAYQVRASQLATVRQDFYNDPAAGGAGDTLWASPLDSYNELFISLIPLANYSSSVTEYAGTADSGQWLQGAQSPSGNFVVGDTRTFDSGHSYRIDWLRGPLAPNLGQYSHASPFNDVCFACASGGAATLGYNLIGDSEPDHIGIEASGGNTNDAVYENGTEVLDDPDVLQVELTGLPAGTTTFREVYDTDFAGDSQVSQTTSTHTDLTFRYTPGSDPSATLPSGYYCDYTGVVATPCQVLPVLTLNYQLAVDQNNTSAAPVQVLGLTVGHLSYDGYGSHAPITSAKVSVSFDGGQTWVPALLAGFDGRYTALWRNPVSAEGTSPELRVTATDAIGGSITQTITAAYTVAAQLK